MEGWAEFRAAFATHECLCNIRTDPKLFEFGVEDGNRFHIGQQPGCVRSARHRCAMQSISGMFSCEYRTCLNG